MCIRDRGRDIAKALETDAVMTELQRTAVGKFRVEDSVSPEKLTEANIGDHLTLPQNAFSGLDTVQIDSHVSQQFLNAVAWQPEQDPKHEALMAIDGQNRLMAVLRRQADGAYTPKLNFAHYWQDA